MTDEITEEFKQRMNQLAYELDCMFNDDLNNRKVGFALLIAEFGTIKEGQVNYISNATREDMLAMMKEFIARAEGRYSQEEGHA